MSQAPVDLVASRASRWLTSCAGLALLGVVVWSVAIARSVPGGFPTGDVALIELNTLFATRGQAVLGPYSQYGWHHPGPLIYYALAPFYALGGYQTIALNAGALAINLGAVFALAAAARRLAHPGLMLSLVACVGAFVIRLDPLLVSAWNPHLIVLMTALLAVAAAATAATGRFCLAMLFVASFLVQTHAATVPFVAATVGASLLWRAGALTREPAATLRQRLATPRVLIGLGVMVLVWVPPVFQQLAGRTPGNVTRLIAFFGDGSDDRLPAGRAVGIWRHGLGLLFDPRLAVPRGRPLGRPRTTFSHRAAVVAVALLPIVLWRARRRGHAGLAALAWVCLFGSAATYWSITRISVIVGDYHVFWIAALGVVNAAVVIAALVEALAARVPRWSLAAWHELAGAGALAALVAVSAASGVQGFASTLRHAGVESRHPSQPARLHRDAMAFLAERGWSSPRVRTSPTSWGEAVGFVTQAVKDGRTVAVEPDLIALVGGHLTPTGREDVLVIFSDNTAVGASVNDPGATLVADRLVGARAVLVYARGL